MRSLVLSSLALSLLASVAGCVPSSAAFFVLLHLMREVGDALIRLLDLPGLRSECALLLLDLVLDEDRGRAFIRRALAYQDLPVGWIGTGSVVGSTPR